MKYLIALAIICIAFPSFADNKELDNLPANYMIWRGRIYNLDYLAGRGVAMKSSEPMVNPTPTESREVRDNVQRVQYENARSLVLIERLQNQR